MVCIRDRNYIEDHHQQEALKTLYDIVDQYKDKLPKGIEVAGSTPISLMIGKIMERDFGVFTGLAILIISFILFFIFKRA